MKHLRVTFSGPPTADIASFVSMSDDQGNDLSAIGVWEHNGVFWEYVIPIELVPRIVMPATTLDDLDEQRRAIYDSQNKVALAAMEKAAAGYPTEDEIRRKKLKEKAAAARALKILPAVAATSEECPNCKNPFDPKKDTLLECPACHEFRCTAVCMPSLNDPCIDCQAVNAKPEDVAGLDVDEPDAFGAALFDSRQLHDGRGARTVRAENNGVPPPPDYDDDEPGGGGNFDEGVTGGGVDGRS